MLSVIDQGGCQYLTFLHRIVGFEDLGNTDQFETATLEWKLLNSGTVFSAPLHSAANGGERRSSRKE